MEAILTFILWCAVLAVAFIVGSFVISILAWTLAIIFVIAKSAVLWFLAKMRQPLNKEN